MKAKLTLLAVAASAFAWFNLHAEDPGKPHDKGPRHGDRGDRGGRGGWDQHRRGGPGHGLFKDLNLTDEQKAKVKSVMESKKPLIDAIREEQMAKMKIVMEDAEKEIRTVLTPEQQKVLDDSKKLREDAMKLRKERQKLRDDKKTETKTE